MTNQANKGNYINPTKVVTGETRLSYANLWDPKSINGGTPKYSVSIIKVLLSKHKPQRRTSAVSPLIQMHLSPFGWPCYSWSAISMRTGIIRTSRYISLCVWLLKTYSIRIGM